MNKEQSYTADNINVLEGLSAIRKRPGMYIGDVGKRGLHHCVYEVIDNSTDEATAGYGKTIKVSLLKNGGIRVEDEGRGIPVENKANGVSAATITLTVLHAGGKFDKDTYKVSGGLHGIGIKATNATSKWLKVTICRNGEIWEQEFEKGEPLYKIRKTGETKKTGTTLEFIPDETIFDSIEYDPQLLIDRLRNSSFLTKNIEFIFINEITKEKEIFLSKNGLEDMLNYQIEPENILTPIMSYSGSDEKRGTVTDKDTGKIEENGILEKFDLEVSFLYETGYKTTISSFVNKILTPGGGVHEQGVLDALSSALLKKVKESKADSKKDKEIISKVNLEDIKEGLVLAISISIYTDIVFEGQTKDKLSGVHLRPMIRNLSKDKIENFLNSNPTMTNKIVQKVITARKARESAERARKTERKQQAEEIGSMLGKLTDCRSNTPEECEIFITEGQSAGGSAKQGRDGRYQAILPLKGKPVNPLKKTWADVISNDEILSIKTALGCGIGDNIDISKLRYHKIINQTDADIDGCLRGNTKIKLLDGRIKTIKELSELYPIGGDTFEVWSYDLENNTPVVGTAHSVRITKKVNKLYEITLCNEFKILATENHPFLDIFGNYCRADELKNGQQLKSLYFIEKEEISENEFFDYTIKDIKIIEVNEEEVFDMTVDKYHNFGIITDDNNKGLVFVHNSHIQQLLLTIFNTLFKPLLEGGYIYTAVPPLHRVKIGKESFYLNTDEDKKNYIIKVTNEETTKIKNSKKYKELYSIEKEELSILEKEFKNVEKQIEDIDKLKISKKYKNVLYLKEEDLNFLKEKNIEKDKLLLEKNKLSIQINNFKSTIYLNQELNSALSKYVFNRFKGLGEMNPDQLAETTMNPETRTLIKLKPNKLYDLSDEINIDNFAEEDISNILSIIERRKQERHLKKEKHPVKDSLIELTIDNIIGLISSDKGKDFRKMYLMRNIIGSEIGD